MKNDYSESEKMEYFSPDRLPHKLNDKDKRSIEQYIKCEKK